MTDRNFEGVSIEMLPLPHELRFGYGYMGQVEHDAMVGIYARSVAEHNVNRERGRAERLTEALQMIEKGSPVEAPDLNDWADADERVDVVENNLRWHFGKIARAALRDHDKEARND